MIDSTVQDITDPQFKMIGGIPQQYGDAFNGKFYWVCPPNDFDEYWTDPITGEDWRYGHCLVDDYGTLHPADLFTHDSDSEQNDEVLDYFLMGVPGADILQISQIEQVLHMHGQCYVVDQNLNVYLVEYNDVFTGHTRVKCIRRGPWGNPLTRVQHNELVAAGLKFLLI